MSQRPLLARFLVLAPLMVALSLTVHAQNAHSQPSATPAQQRTCNHLAQSLLEQRSAPGNLSYQFEAAHYDPATRACYVMARVSDPKSQGSDPGPKTEVILDARSGAEVAILTTNPKGKSVCWTKNQLGQGAQEFNRITKQLGLEAATKD
jgi:hypothetical protein